MSDGKPEHIGSWHWLEAERLLEQAETLANELDLSWPELAAKHDRLLHRADVHVRLAQAAPVYAWHQEPREVVADSPNIRPGENEAPVPFRASYPAIKPHYPTPPRARLEEEQS